MTTTGSWPISVYAPDVALRGTRNYVHSTDLYEQLLVGAGAAGLAVDGSIDLRFRRLVVTQPEFRYSQSLPDVEVDAPVVFSISTQGALWHGMVREREVNVVQRKPYDEMELWARAVRNGRTIQFEGDIDMQPIEVVTALAVSLHRGMFPETGDRKWLLTRIELGRPLVSEDRRMVRIELTRSVAMRITRSSIKTTRGTIGHLEFMLGDTHQYP
jgi:hypothetical protein